MSPLMGGLIYEDSAVEFPVIPAPIGVLVWLLQPIIKRICNVP
jgi:hypothetical protein